MASSSDIQKQIQKLQAQLIEAQAREAVQASQARQDAEHFDGKHVYVVGISGHNRSYYHPASASVMVYMTEARALENAKDPNMVAKVQVGGLSIGHVELEPRSNFTSEGVH